MAGAQPPVAVAGTLNRLAVKIDGDGRLWLDGRRHDGAGRWPRASRGELRFRAEDACLLLGPWGPSLQTHLLLSGRCGRIDRHGVEVQIGRQTVRAAWPASADGELPTRTGRRVWLSVPWSALEYRR